MTNGSGEGSNCRNHWNLLLKWPVWRHKGNAKSMYICLILACYIGSCLKMFIASYVFTNFECSQERLIARKHCLLTADNSVTRDSCMAFYPKNHWNWSLGGQLFSSFCSNISKFQWDHLLGCSEIRFCYQGTIFCVKSSIVL